MKKKMAKATKQLESAKVQLEKAKKAHRAAFRLAVAALFTEYGLCLEADGDLSAHLTIKEFGESGEQFNVKDLPE